MPIPEGLVEASGVVVLEDLGTQSDARLADKKPWTGDHSRKVSTLGPVSSHWPAEVVAERTSRRVRELATLGKREDRWKIHAPSLPVVVTPHDRLNVPLEGFRPGGEDAA